MSRTQPKITIIYDNRKDSLNLQEGFGFSCLIEWDGRKILFDTGGDQEIFFANVEQLDIRLEEITHVIFSHKHWDHTAGLERLFMKLRKDVVIYVPKRFPKALLKTIPSTVSLQIVKSFTHIDEGVYSLVLKATFFLYEQSLLLDTAKGLIIVTGCSHPGIIRIIKKAKEKLQRNIYLVIGGFHLYKSESKISAEVVKQFQELDVEKVAPCHCAGEEALRQFQEAYLANFIRTGAGTVLEI